MADIAIETKALTKYYGRVPAVNQINLTIPRGSVTALMGRNGSGKTTTVRMLLGLEVPTRGHAAVLGCDSRRLTPEVRARIGYLSESHFAYRWMKLGAAAQLQAQTFPRWNQDVFEGVIDHFGLNPGSNVSSLSRGERAGLCLALTLALEPELLILDDPALGLDPVARRSLVEAMLAVTGHRDRTILFSSHMLDDIERVADQVVIIESGCLKVQTSVDSFCRHVSVWRLIFDVTPDRLPAIPGVVHMRYAGNEILLTVANADGDTEAAIHSVGADRVEQVDVSFEQAAIDYLSARRQRESLLQAVARKSGGGAPVTA